MVYAFEREEKEKKTYCNSSLNAFLKSDNRLVSQHSAGLCKAFHQPHEEPTRNRAAHLLNIVITYHTRIGDL